MGASLNQIVLYIAAAIAGLWGIAHLLTMHRIEYGESGQLDEQT